MELGAFDRSGRRKPVARGENDFTLPADTVIAAIGQALEAGALFGSEPAPRLNERGYLYADPLTGQTSMAWVFAGGDAVSGPASVVEAVGAGERAAAGIDRYLTGADHAPWRTTRPADTFFDPEAEPVMGSRPEVKMIPVSERKGSFAEVELSWTRSVALRESRRCLRCDYREPAAAAGRSQTAPTAASR